MRPLEVRSRFLSRVTFGCIAMLLVLWPIHNAPAATPGEINFQGLLLDSGGEVIDGLVDLDFELFDAASAGTSLWSESQPDVFVLDGVYNVALGSVTPIGPGVLAGGSLWLEITVESETLAPRQRLLAVPYALRAAETDHAASADSADSAANLPIGSLAAIYATFPFDGAAPANDDPSEGLADTDNDGILNFIDPDNDNDGIPDGDEVSQGSNINLTTPTISNATPSIADDIFPTPVVVTGTNFIAGQTVTVGPQTPTPTNITPTSFDIVLDAQPAPTSTSLTVTRPNGEQASLAFNFELTLPSITSLAPYFVGLSETATVEVVGTDFLGAFTVTVDGNPLTPYNVTATSFSIDVDTPASPGSPSVVVTLSNGQSASQPLEVGIPKTVFITSTSTTGDLGGLAGADALCASHATAGGLSGTFLAWLGDSTGSPATRFTQSSTPYRRVDKAIVADDYADLLIEESCGILPFGCYVQVPINIDEFGNTQFSGPWTNVATDGMSDGEVDCTDWSSTSGQGRGGVATQLNAAWTSGANKNCSTTHTLYCFEQ